MWHTHSSRVAKFDSVQFVMTPDEQGGTRDDVALDEIEVCTRFFVLADLPYPRLLALPLKAGTEASRASAHVKAGIYAPDILGFIAGAGSEDYGRC